MINRIIHISFDLDHGQILLSFICYLNYQLSWNFFIANNISCVNLQDSFIALIPLPNYLDLIEECFNLFLVFYLLLIDVVQLMFSCQLAFEFLFIFMGSYSLKA